MGKPMNQKNILEAIVIQNNIVETLNDFNFDDMLLEFNLPKFSLEKVKKIKDTLKNIKAKKDIKAFNSVLKTFVPKNLQSKEAADKMFEKTNSETKNKYKKKLKELNNKGFEGEAADVVAKISAVSGKDFQLKSKVSNDNGLYKEISGWILFFIGVVLLNISTLSLGPYLLLFMLLIVITNWISYGTI